MQAANSEQSPVRDSVAKVDDAVAVGENLDFQRKWWTFERTVWIIFSLIIACDIAGLFGRGPLAQAESHAADGSLNLHYERIERTSTPSIMTFRFGPTAVHNGNVQLYVSDSVLRHLGAQRIAPQPAVSAIGKEGLTYTFPVTSSDGLVEIGLEPVLPGFYSFQAAVPGGSPVNGRVLVMP